MSDHDPGFEKRYLAAIERARAISKQLAGPSLVERLARLPSEKRDAIFAQLSTIDLVRLLFDWAAWARPKQDPDLSAVEHRILFFLTGRGFGKSLSGAQRIRRRVNMGARSIALIGPTLGEVEKYMIGGRGGSDGILSVFPESQRPKWRPHKRELEFHTGAIGYANTAEEKEFRGANLDTIWADEPGKWRYLDTLWMNIELSTRLPGKLPLELVITGTPIPARQFREWIADDDTVTILGSTTENAGNTDPKWQKKMQQKLGGTRLGRQELEGEILTDNPDALFQSSILDRDRVEDAPELVDVAVAVDPAIATERRDNDDTGIVAGGIAENGHLYILADLTTEKAKPEKWGGDVIAGYEQLRASVVVGERNRGGDLVASNVRAALERKRGRVASKAIKIVEVHATRGKAIRAEPVSTLHEKGMIHIVGRMPELEAELTEWNPRVGGVSPNRLDALVWLIWYLAKIGDNEDAKTDYKQGFKGIGKVAKALKQDRHLIVPGLTSIPRAEWGSKI